MPDHSTLSRTRQRLPLAVQQAVFALILGIVEAMGLLKGRVLGVDSTYLRADASMTAIVWRDTQESYTEFVTRLATEAGVPTPTAEDARRLDRKRTGKKTSNREWVSRTDPDARIAQLKDGRTRVADKPAHVVDLEPGAIVAAGVHPAPRRRSWPFLAPGLSCGVGGVLIVRRARVCALAGGVGAAGYRSVAMVGPIAGQAINQRAAKFVR